jgi:large subunit ribosomal protein L4e
MSRPLVSVFDSANAGNVVSQANLPAVMTAPIRPDIVNYVHNLMSKNSRQAYAVSKLAGMQTPAQSWGTGRAVARIPRVPGGGTSRSGQGAFGNMCRGGRMFAPTKIWRRWHRKINVNQRRYAVSSALAASAVVPLVMARGHRVDAVPELPLVLSDSVNSCSKTKDALAILKSFGADADVQKCKDSRKVRTGAGKMRNRRYVMRRGPLVVYDNDEGLVRGFKNLPGVECAHVDNLNLLDLAPGGHLGRFIIWTEGAFNKLDQIFGTLEKNSASKSGFNLPHGNMTNADLARLINSDEIQSVVKPAVTSANVLPPKRNPLKNADVMAGLNPYAATAKARSAEKAAASRKNRQAVIKERRAFTARKKAFVKAASLDGDVTF